jgi:hypothetical protein
MKNSVDYALFSLMTSERSWFLSFCCEKCVFLSLSFFLSFVFYDEVVVIVVVLGAPYPLTVSEYLELIVMNGTLGE